MSAKLCITGSPRCRPTSCNLQKVTRSPKKTSVTHSHTLRHIHTSAQSWVSWQPNTNRVPYPVRPLSRSSNYSYTLDSVHVVSRACPMSYPLDVIVLLSQGCQPLKMPIQPPQTLMEWLTSIHIPVPDNAATCKDSKLDFDGIRQLLTGGNAWGSISYRFWQRHGLLHGHLELLLEGWFSNYCYFCRICTLTQ